MHRFHPFPKKLNNWSDLAGDGVGPGGAGAGRCGCRFHPFSSLENLTAGGCVGGGWAREAGGGKRRGGGHPESSVGATKGAPVPH